MRRAIFVDKGQNRQGNPSREDQKRAEFFTADAVDFDAPETDKNRLKIVWYNQPYMLQKVKADEKYFVFGKVKFSGRRAELINPKIEPLDKQKNLSGIMPVYRTKGAVQQGVFKGIVDDALRKFSPADIANEKCVKGTASKV